MTTIKTILPSCWHGFSTLVNGTAANDVNVDPAASKSRRRVIEITRYQCSECSEVYDDEDEAAECCQEQDAGDAACPVCDEKYASHREAADCCLWKDIDALTRWKIAGAVEAGSTWAEQIQALAQPTRSTDSSRL